MFVLEDTSIDNFSIDERLFEIKNIVTEIEFKREEMNEALDRLQRVLSSEFPNIAQNVK